MEDGTLGSINLNGGGAPEVVDLSGKIHLLPCSIKFDGPCSVSHYFRPKPTGKTCHHYFSFNLLVYFLLF